MKCVRCKVEKPERFFYKDRSKKTGYRPRCKKCEKYYIDKERRRKYEKLYWDKRRERKREIVLRSMHDNLQNHQNKQQEYRETQRYKELHRKDSALRRVRQSKAFVEHIDYGKFYESSDKKCFYCKKPLLFEESEFDHFIPIAKNGKHELSNIRLSCLKCNRKKAAKLPQEVSYQMV